MISAQVRDATRFIESGIQLLYGAQPAAAHLRFCCKRGEMRHLSSACLDGGRCWDRTSDPCRVKAVLYR